MSSNSSVVDEKTATSPSPVADSGYVRPILGKGHKTLMLTLFCLAEFMDALISSALFPAIVKIDTPLNIASNESVWLFASYNATFAAFLLISGRASDIYSSKWSFVIGSAFVGLFSLGCGLVHGKVAMFVLRALTGIGAAMTVPSALSLIVEWFPDPEEQAQGIALFGGASAIGNVLGIIIGGLIASYTTWRWIFYLVAILGVGIAIISLLVVPKSAPRLHKPSWKRLDLGGVFMITAGSLLFVFAVTTGSVEGWGKAKVIAPLIIGIILFVGFFFFEGSLDEHMASLPPKVWRYHNIPILMCTALIPFWWWCSLFFQLMPLFQEEYGWSPIITALHFLPTGVVSAAVAGVSSKFVQWVDPKWTIFGGLVLEAIATILLPFADTPHRYYSFMIPSFCIGTIGTMVLYTNANIAVFMNTPPEIAGVVGAVFNAALQLGVAVGLAIQATIATSIDVKRIAQGKPRGYTGVADSFWFLFAVVVVMMISVLVFYKVTTKPAKPDVETPASTGVSGAEGLEAVGDAKH